MIGLLLSIVLAVIFAYVALQNNTSVGIQIAQWQFVGIPLYIVSLGSLLVGLVIAWVFSLFEKGSFALTMYGKDNQLRAEKQHVQNLERKVEELERENNKLHHLMNQNDGHTPLLTKLRQSLAH